MRSLLCEDIKRRIRLAHLQQLVGGLPTHEVLFVRTFDLDIVSDTRERPMTGTAL